MARGYAIGEGLLAFYQSRGTPPARERAEEDGSLAPERLGDVLTIRLLADPVVEGRVLIGGEPVPGAGESKRARPGRPRRRAPRQRHAPGGKSERAPGEVSVEVGRETRFRFPAAFEDATGGRD